MTRSFASLILILGVLGGLVSALPAPTEVTGTSSSGAPTASATATQISSPTPTVPLTSSDVPTSNSGTSATRTIILVVIFVVLPTLGLYFCCVRHKIPCFGSRKDKRQYYNAAHPTQIPGGVYLVPVNHFVPPDARTGYTVRVDTPSNPLEMAQPVYPELHPPPRAASPGGREDGKHGGWKGLFKG